MTMMSSQAETVTFNAESEDRAKDILQKAIYAKKRKQRPENAKKPEISLKSMVKKASNRPQTAGLGTIFEQMGWDYDCTPSGPSEEAGIL